MDEVKSIFLSRTFWGALASVAAGLLALFGYELGAADREGLVEAVSGLGATLGGLVAIWGRVKASKRIG
jgi:hypothetical protein